MIPCFAVDSFEPSQLLILLRIGRQQSYFTAFGNNNQPRRRGEKQHLPVAETAFLPESLAGRCVEAAQNAVVETKDMSFVNHEVIEARLQRRRLPFLCNSPRA